jgi:chorismate mutase/prephenate dehydratase
MNLYYLGPEETFSHRAATRMAKPGEMPVPCANFSEVFHKLAIDPDGAAVVPFENTSQGPVTEVMDLLAEHHSITAVECRAIPVHQHLLSRDLTTPIRQILSKAEALAQCRATLNHIYPEVPLIAVSSTAEAARLAAEDPTLAAVAGESTAERYKLTLRRADVQDVQDNTTRFFRLEVRNGTFRGRTTDALPSTHALLRVEIDDHPGSLLEVLETLKTLDLTFIQSRPLHGERWKYAFFMELLIGNSGIPIATVMANIRKVARDVRILGDYTITTQPTVPDASTTTALSSLRAMIADIDASLIRAFAGRRAYHLNPSLYVHAEPVDMHDLARAFAIGDATEQTRLLRRFYLTTVVPYLAAQGEDTDPREALYADTEVISALARRCQFSKKVIARKRVELAPELRSAAQTGDPAAVENALLNQAVEEKVLARIVNFAEAEHFDPKGRPESVVRHLVALYRDYLLPLSRLIQVYVILEDLAD